MNPFEGGVKRPHILSQDFGFRIKPQKKEPCIPLLFICLRKFSLSLVTGKSKVGL